MKIGIFTFYHAHNYGASLQAYALKTYLESKNYDVKIIEYVPNGMKNIYSINPFVYSKGILQVGKKAIRSMKRFKQYMIFRDFIMRELACEGEFSWEQQMNECGTLITGSDQVWNTGITSNDDIYFLPFDNNKIKLSYAASIGSTKNIKQLEIYLNEYVTKFQGVSVREASSISLIENILKIKPTLVCDPVFLLSKNEWHNFAVGVNPEKQPYILYYSLQFNQQLYDETIKLANEQNLKIYAVHPTNQSMGKGVINLNGIGPREFVSLIENAQYVSTNSFHALVFSIIFEKDVLHYQHRDLGVRTVDLLMLMGVNRSDVDGLIMTKSLNYQDLETVIDNSKIFLSNNIEIGLLHENK